MEDIKLSYKLKSKKMHKDTVKHYKTERENEYDPDLVVEKEPTWKQELAAESRDKDLESKESSNKQMEDFINILIKRNSESLKKRGIDNNTLEGINQRLGVHPLDIAAKNIRNSKSYDYSPIMGASFVEPGDIITKTDGMIDDRFIVVKVEEEINKIWIWDQNQGAVQVNPEEYVLVAKTSPEVVNSLLKRMDKIQQRPLPGIYTI